MYEDLTGRRFGNWLVVERGPDHVTHPPSRQRPKTDIQYLCRCECAACVEEPVERLVRANRLRHGRSKSCGRINGRKGHIQERPVCTVDGCERRCLAITHELCNRHQRRLRRYGTVEGLIDRYDHRGQGGRGNPTFRTWSSMVTRCTNPKADNWSRYGGADPPVKVCDRWLQKPFGFLNFVEDMGDRPSLKHQLHRVENTPLYSPETCRWLTRAEHRRVHRDLRRAEAHPRVELEE